MCSCHCMWGEKENRKKKNPVCAGVYTCACVPVPCRLDICGWQWNDCMFVWCVWKIVVKWREKKTTKIQGSTMWKTIWFGVERKQIKNEQNIFHHTNRLFELQSFAGFAKIFIWKKFVSCCGVLTFFVSIVACEIVRITIS